ncbi:uncharacterized protein EAF01_002539 [Botrytis porri]|uniref:uncharacterized protein n=1 Tax=Botrytis porri TaxID=87229 RepID=UPI0019020884|nr:uncharacterized protein EAF01_002539 [Botrytis porri]KAF7911031.1 hypothetical protein EAF01_002539 [Botrytis porri]
MSCTFAATTALVAVEGRFCDWIGQSSGRPAPGAPGTCRQQDSSFLQLKDDEWMNDDGLKY